MHCCKRVHTLSVALLFLLAVPGRSARAQFSNAPGFGNPFTRKKVDLKRRLPPVVNIAGKSIGVTVEGGGTLPKELQSALENLLTRNDSSVQVGGTKPDLVIVSSITLYAPPKMTTTTENKVTTNTFTGSLAVSFRIGEPTSGRIIKSGVASNQINQPASAPSTVHIPGFHPAAAAPGAANIQSTLDVENALVADVSRQIASYVVNTDEVVPVLLATGGALAAPNKLALSSLWSRDLEDLETLTPFSDPRVDAYRLYNIGVANEALAYGAQDSKAAVKYLQEASTDYGKALAARSDEKYFLEPQNRIKTALAHYDSAPGPVVGTLNPATDAHAQAPAASGGLSNEDVIAMVAAHMDLPNILDNIQSAPKVSFDLSVGGQVQLLHNGITNQLLAAMKQKARASTSATR